MLPIGHIRKGSVRGSRLTHVINNMKIVEKNIHFAQYPCKNTCPSWAVDLLWLCFISLT
jgi:hypothetical protein